MGNCVSFNKDVYVGVNIEQYISKNKHLEKNIIEINVNDVANNPNISNNEKILTCMICFSNDQLVKLLTDPTILKELSTDSLDKQFYIKLLSFHLTNNIVDMVYLEINDKIFKYNLVDHLANLPNKKIFYHDTDDFYIRNQVTWVNGNKKMHENLKIILCNHIHNIYPIHSDLFDYFKFGTTELIRLVNSPPIDKLNKTAVDQKHLTCQNEYKFMKLYDPSLDFHLSNDEQNKKKYDLLKSCDHSNFVNFAIVILNNNLTLTDAMFENLMHSKNFDNYKNSCACVNYLISQNNKIMLDIKKKEQYLNNINNTNTIDKPSIQQTQQIEQSNPLNPPNTPEKPNEPNESNETNKAELTNYSTDQLTNQPSYNEIINLAITEENWLNNNIKNVLLLEKIILDCPECLLLNINSKKILIKNFKIINVLTHFNDSELLLFFILSNKLNIYKKYKFHDNLEYQALNKLFYEIFSKLNNNCTIFVKYEYNAFEDYYLQLANLFDEQYQTF